MSEAVVVALITGGMDLADIAGVVKGGTYQ